jgi:hypothetical protein
MFLNQFSPEKIAFIGGHSAGAAGQNALFVR